MATAPSWHGLHWEENSLCSVLPAAGFSPSSWLVSSWIMLVTHLPFPVHQLLSVSSSWDISLLIFCLLYFDLVFFLTSMSILPAPLPPCPSTSASALPVQFSHGMSAVSLNSAYKTILFALIFTIHEVNASLISLSSAQMICSSSFISQSLFFLYLSISAQDFTPPPPHSPWNWKLVANTGYPISTLIFYTSHLLL